MAELVMFENSVFQVVDPGEVSVGDWEVVRGRVAFPVALV